MTAEVRLGDCRDVMARIPPGTVDAIVCDPPYELGFMGRAWDSSGIAYDADVWRHAITLLRPGGHLVAFGGSRTYHRLACAIEDQGFEIRDQLQWLYGSGFPKSLDVGKAMDWAAGAEREVIGEKRGPDGQPYSQMQKPGSAKHGEGWQRPWMDDPERRDAVNMQTAPATDLARQWDGWGTALKPAHEPIVLARKPLIGTVAANVAQHGTGGLNIDGCRIEGVPPSVPQPDFGSVNGRATHLDANRRNGEMSQATGRWPANVVLDEEAGALLDQQSGPRGAEGSAGWNGPRVPGVTYGPGLSTRVTTSHGDQGGASRFFYCAKASRGERNAGLDARPHTAEGYEYPRKPMANVHPTVKPISLMRWLVRLITPPGGLVLDPFAGSGTTGCAAVLEGMRFLGIDQDPEYVEIARRRIAHWAGVADEPRQPGLWGQEDR